MSQISALSRRIKTVATIHRTSSAMRLIAMSTQGRLRRREGALARYQEAVGDLLKALGYGDHAEAVPAEPSLVIIASSYKGLCGAFNEHLLQFVRLQHPLARDMRIVTLGKIAADYVRAQGIVPLEALEGFSVATHGARAQRLCELIVRSSNQSALCIMQSPRTFFIQQPRATLVSLAALPAVFAPDQRPLYEMARMMQLKATVMRLLYDASLAEQAARFLSMDTATRNAEDLLQQMKLDYNKLRQAAVTRELIELTSGVTAHVD